ncbi:MAG TPA: hypothetical protein VNO84_14175 [Burkholderiaceae bacterium]|nr:hypothetical protein [Burkholderiaceae bacterium]
MKPKVVVFAQLVDGSAQEFEAGAELPAQLRNLRSMGLEGKQLIHKLITDDWGPPPRFVEIKEYGEDGTFNTTRIPYV